MTPTEMEEAIKNLQLQANRLEEFLPTLATREELHAVRDQVVRHAVIMNEQTRDRIKVLGEGVEDVRARMATKEELMREIGGLRDQMRLEMRALEHNLSVNLSATISAQIGAQIAELAKHVSALRPRRRKE